MMRERTAPIVALDAPALAAAIRDAAGGGRYAVADARLGTWTPQAIATQWMGQIVGQDVLLKSDAPKMTSPTWLSDALASGIDEESKGNRALLAAFETARQLCRLLARRPSALVLLAPAGDAAWLSESELLLGYLAEMSPQTRVTVVATEPLAPGAPASAGSRSDPATAIRANSLVSAMPTALSPRLRALLGDEDTTDLLILDNGWAVATPESRRGEAWQFSDADLARFSQPGLAAFRSFATFHAQPGASGAMQRAFEAWRLCYIGPRELAPLLMDRAVAGAATPAERDVLVAQRQAMRIVMSSFAEAAAEPPAPESADPAVASGIEEGRGWGLVMTGQGMAARDALRRARALRGNIDPPDRAALLLMNISALAELRSGDAAGAMDLEKVIERGLDQMAGAEELRFVNSINQARLYRYANDFDQSERYYGRAFATVQGGRTETDQVNVNLCFARLAMARDDHKDALLHWVRAAMQWCANACLEALNWRVQMLVIEKARRIAVTSHAEAQALVETLAEGFVHQLDRLAAINGIKIDVDGEAALPFFASDAVLDRATAPRALGGIGWSVLAAQVDRQPRPSGPMLQRLRAWLAGWIRRQSAAGDENCFLVDRRDGGEMPVDWATALASAVDHGAEVLEFDGRRIALDPDDVVRAQRARRLAVNPFVTRVRDGDAPLVEFRRYFPPLAPSPIQSALIDCARVGMPLGAALAGHPERPAELDSLRRARVICLAGLAPGDADLFAAAPEIGLAVHPRPVAQPVQFIRPRIAQ